MATKTVRIDDIDGTEAVVTTTTFAIDGVKYSIDLSAKNSKKFADAMAPFVTAAQRLGGNTAPTRSARKSRVRSTPARSDKEQLADIRAWAAAEGYQVSGRGRISTAIREAYDAAHNAS